MEFDLLNPNPAEELTKHKLKKLIQKPNSFFLDIKCFKCPTMTHTFSHAQSTILCSNEKCNEVLATPTGGKLELKDGVKIRKKAE
jgi:small subunit ribosomal protein S27e